MKKIKVFRLKDQKVLADACSVAESFASRFMGLMGKARLEPGQGLWLKPCNSIHTFFMRFDIDVVYLDRENKVVSIRRAMKPWRMDFPVFSAASVLELPSGAASDLSRGDLLCTS